MFLGNILPLYNHLVLFGYHTQNLAGSTFIITGYNLNHIAFFYVQSHNSYLVSREAYPARNPIRFTG